MRWKILTCWLFPSVMKWPILLCWICWIWPLFLYAALTDRLFCRWYSQADLLVWSGNPLESWEARVVTAYQAGEAIYREGDALRCM